MNKYVLTTNTKKHLGKTLYQIKALQDFGNVKADDLGGYIEKEGKLSQENLCWVHGNAFVYDNAKVYGNARVYGDAFVYDNAKVYGDAFVYDNAKVYSDALVFGNAWVYGNAKVTAACKKTPIVMTGLRWPVCITDNHMTIGCQTHTLKEWASFSNEEITEMHPDAWEFWDTFGAMLLSIREVV
jgi:hypothetical protein